VHAKAQVHGYHMKRGNPCGQVRVDERFWVDFQEIFIFGRFYHQ